MLLLKTLHVLSSTLLFGTGLGTAFHMWRAHCRGDPRTVAAAARSTVLADWLFTVPSGIAQPVTGFALVLLQGWSPWEPWLVTTYGLYALAGACWLRVALLQMRAARLAQAAAEAGSPLPPAYHRAMQEWFVLGWPAFLGLVLVFWLMVAKPSLW